MSTVPRFESIFRSGEARKDNYLSRLFGLFSEEVVRQWASLPEAPYEDLGRPTLFRSNLPRWHTLDFTFRHRVTGRTYVSEMKCELAFDNYRYLRLTDSRQFDHHTGAAFQKFLTVARDPTAFEARIAGKPIPVDGAERGRRQR